jgi:hypothetical protein
MRMFVMRKGLGYARFDRLALLAGTALAGLLMALPPAAAEEPGSGGKMVADSAARPTLLPICITGSPKQAFGNPPVQRGVNDHRHLPAFLLVVARKKGVFSIAADLARP